MPFNKTLLAGLIIALSMVATSCSKKSGPSTAADADSSSETADSTIEESSTDESMAGDSSDVLANLPTIYFEFDESTLSSEARSSLQDVATALEGSSSTKITIEGHCDERGSNEYNLALGERRARSIKQYLERLGVSSGQLSIISYGEERPAALGSGESAWAKNRRAELITN